MSFEQWSSCFRVILSDTRDHSVRLSHSLSLSLSVIIIRFAQPSYSFNESDGTGRIELEKVGISSSLIRVMVSGGKNSSYTIQ